MKIPDRVDIPTLAAIARRAGERILAIYGQETIERMLKADMSPVTAADLAAHAEIAQGLRAMTPGVPIVSEEDLPMDPAAIVRSAPLCWLVDPLDGTRDFLSRTGDFTVNIALMVEGRPAIGCVYAPVRDESYTAVSGRGALRAKGQAAPVPIRTRALQKDFHALVSTWHRSDEAERIRNAFPHAHVKRVGSSLKYVQIAAAEADIAIRLTPTSLWDTAAAQCILEEAGGALLTLAGKPLDYARGEIENPAFIAVGDRAMDVTAWLQMFGGSGP